MRKRFTPPRRRRALCPLLALACLLYGCGTDDPPRPVRRLVFAPPAEAPREEPVLVARLLPPRPDSEGRIWGVAPGQGRRIETARGVTLLRIDAPSTVRVRVPCPLDGREVNEIRLLLTDRRRMPLSLHLWRGNRRVGVPHLGLATPRGRARLLSVPVPELRAEEQPADAIELIIPARRGELDLLAVELWRVPPIPEPPAAGEPPPLIAIQGDARRGFALSSLHPLRCRTELPPNGNLVLDWGAPPGWIPDPERTRLVLEVESGGGLREFELTLERGKLHSPWRTLRLGPPDIPPGPLALRVSLECEGQEVAYAVIARPRIVTPLEDPPTVLLVTSDTHRADHVGFDPQAVRIETPILDRLAREGLSFERAFSATNVTNPSHVAILTGVSPRDSRLFDNYHPISDAPETLAERFAEAGWMTAASISSRHLLPRFSGLGQGFDRVDGPTQAVREGTVSIHAALAELEHHPGEPLFVWLHVFDAHTPYDPSPEVLARYWPEDRDPRDRSLPPLPIADQLPDWLAGVRDPAYPRALYAAEVTALDAALEPLLFHPRARAGVTVFTADHGESLGEHQTYYDHAGLYTQTVRVPLILRWPGGPAAARVSRPVSLLSLPRTVFELAGLSASGWPGERLAADPAPSGGEPCFLVSSNRLAAAIVVDRWLLSLQLAGGLTKRSLERRGAHDTRLFDLEQDPACEHDLAGARPEVARDLRARLVAWLRAETPRGWVDPGQVNEELESTLNELGYTGPVPVKLWDQPLWRDDDCEWCRRFR